MNRIHSLIVAAVIGSTPLTVTAQTISGFAPWQSRAIVDRVDAQAAATSILRFGAQLIATGDVVASHEQHNTRSISQPWYRRGDI